MSIDDDDRDASYSDLPDLIFGLREPRRTVIVARVTIINPRSGHEIDLEPRAWDARDIAALLTGLVSSDVH